MKKSAALYLLVIFSYFNSSFAQIERTGGGVLRDARTQVALDRSGFPARSGLARDQDRLPGPR